MATLQAQISKLQVKSGQEKAIKQFFSSWEKQFNPVEQGVNSAYLMQVEGEPESYYMVVTFESDEALRRYKEHESEIADQLHELLSSHPQTAAGEVVATVSG